MRAWGHVVLHNHNIWSTLLICRHQCGGLHTPTQFSCSKNATTGQRSTQACDSTLVWPRAACGRGANNNGAAVPCPWASTQATVRAWHTVCRICLRVPALLATKRLPVWSSCDVGISSGKWFGLTAILVRPHKTYYSKNNTSTVLSVYGVFAFQKQH